MVVLLGAQKKRKLIKLDRETSIKARKESNSLKLEESLQRMYELLKNFGTNTEITNTAP